MLDMCVLLSHPTANAGGNGDGVNNGGCEAERDVGEGPSTDIILAQRHDAKAQ